MCLIQLKGLIFGVGFGNLVGFLETVSMQENIEWRANRVIDLNDLVVTLEGNKEKIGLMLRTFVAETPGYFSSLRNKVEEKNKTAICQLLHTLKARYGYFGLGGVMKEMDDWEMELADSFDHQRNLHRLNYFEKLNTEIMDELKKSEFYEPTKPIDTDPDLPLKGKVVLIAEDDEINAMVFELFIEELGGRVVKAADGHEAVKQVMDNAINFVFMDIHMPYFSGVEAIRLLRAKGITIPIVALSASTRLQEKQQSLDAGASGFLTKPAKREIIRDILLKYLS